MIITIITQLWNIKKGWGTWLLMIGIMIYCLSLFDNALPVDTYHNLSETCPIEQFP